MMECSNIEQIRDDIATKKIIQIVPIFRNYFREYERLRDMTRTEVTNMTGCNPPCFYRKYTQVGKTFLVNKDKFGGGRESHIKISLD